MSLAERIATMRDHMGRPCKLMAIYARVSPDDQTAIDAVIEDLRDARLHGQVVHSSSPMVSAASLARALTAEGHQISPDSVQAHTYYRCGCLHGSD